MVAFLLLVNMAMQVSFVLIVVRNLTDITFDEDVRDQFRSFRTSVAHDFLLMDQNTGQSLAARVCNVDSGLHVGVSQSQAVGIVREYLELGSPFNGPLMCVMASLAWALTVAKEFRAIADQFGAILSGNVSIQEVCLESMGTSRRCMCASILMSRFAIACALLVFGGHILGLHGQCCRTDAKCSRT